MQQHSRPQGRADISMAEVIALFKGQKDPESKIKFLLFLISFFFTPLTLAGILLGYVRAYNRSLRNKFTPPLLYNLPAIVRLAMIIGGVFIWLLVISVFYTLIFFLHSFFSERFMSSPAPLILIALNIVFTFIVFAFFNRWRRRLFNELYHSTRYGSARFSRTDELEDLTKKNGLYIGNNTYTYSKQLHLISFCKVRGGKGTNLILPNLLGKGNYSGSWFVLDIKGELYAITQRYQREAGQMVFALDPWFLQTREGVTFNPLDILSKDPNDERLSDDADSLAEIFVPIDANTRDAFFTDRSRSLICGLIMHICLSQDKDHRNLTTLWKWLRSSPEEFDDLLGQMSVSDNPVVQACANETANVMSTSPKTFTSILSSAQQYTDFLKSVPLQKSLASSSFNVNDLTNGKTTLYVIIPADLLATKAQWLKLIVASTTRAVIKNRNKRVTMLLDEFSSLGFIREIETAVNTLAGYNLTVWPFLTSLSALKRQYPNSWENFIANSAVRHFTSIADEETASYVSSLMGDTTILTSEGGPTGRQYQTSARKLLTPDEVRRGSATHIFTFIDQRPPSEFEKIGYYEMPDLDGRHDPNPYYTGE